MWTFLELLLWNQQFCRNCVKEISILTMNLTIMYYNNNENKTITQNGIKYKQRNERTNNIACLHAILSESQDN